MDATGRDPGAELEGENRGVGVGGSMWLGAHQIRSVKPRCRCMAEDELLSTDRTHSKYRSCSCCWSLGNKTNTRRMQSEGRIKEVTGGKHVEKCSA